MRNPEEIERCLAMIREIIRRENTEPRASRDSRMAAVGAAEILEWVLCRKSGAEADMYIKLIQQNDWCPVAVGDEA